MASDDQIMSHILTKNNLESKKEGKKKQQKIVVAFLEGATGVL